MNVLILLGHPRRESFCGVLADAYYNGASQSGASVKLVHIAALKFEENVVIPDPENQHFEDDLVTVRHDILWADHLVFVFPTWWGSMPGLLKSFLDRVITPRFAFNETGKWQYEKLLKGRTAQIITTMDTPVLIYKYIYKSPGVHLLASSTLQFCGVWPVRKKLISPVKYATEEQRQRWLQEVTEIGLKLDKGVITSFEKFMNRITPWLRALRLQFYPMTFIAYATGAYAARHYGYVFDVWVMITGYLFLFILEAATVFSNEYFDYESDIKNKNFGPFNGGSRVLTEKLITREKLLSAIKLCIVLLVPVFLILNYLSPAEMVENMAVCAVISVLALGYTMPPLKLSWRGLGELDVAITHSIAVMMCGFVFQGGSINNPDLWLISLPLLLSIIPAIILSGIPDYEADKAANKKTIPVRVGKNAAAFIALAFVLAATCVAVFLHVFGWLPHAFGNVIYLTLPHALYLSYLIFRFIRLKNKPSKIDGLMVVSLLYIFWFGIIPLVKLY